VKLSDGWGKIWPSEARPNHPFLTALRGSPLHIMLVDRGLFRRIAEWFTVPDGERLEQGVKPCSLYQGATILPGQASIN